jgi:UDP-N-acetylmuramoyl-L-alanyl-D-glutamate--2,6-diaminopimelate ligase
MDVAALVAGLNARVVGDPSPVIARLAYHTGDVVPGTMFFCIPGLTADGHAFAPAAVAAGAVALVCERQLDLPVTQIVVPSVRRALAHLSARWFGDPSAHLKVAAVTGTNGKTTTAHLLAAGLGEAGVPSGLLGTVVNRVGGVDSPVALTTAESYELQRLFASMVAAGDQACAMEASSHALALDRTEAIHFAAVLFTNLTRDHLDFHNDLEDYYLAKRRLFLPGGARRPGAVAVVNVGDEYGRRLARECAPFYGDDLWAVAVSDDAEHDDAVVAARDVVLRADGSSFTLAAPRIGLRERVDLKITARFNVENALLAATTLLALGVPVAAVKRALGATGGVAGRFEAVRAGQPFTVLVDYSHTPDSLENALRAGRGLAAGQLRVVFGCGGDRDRGKRPLMGEIGARLADQAIVTSDNPRSEDPDAIIAEILAGVPAELRERVIVEPDRRAAIALALGAAGAGDVVLIAGKGHEQGQIIAGTKIPFDDRQVATELLEHASGAKT